MVLKKELIKPLRQILLGQTSLKFRLILLIMPIVIVAIYQFGQIDQNVFIKSIYVSLTFLGFNKLRSNLEARKSKKYNDKAIV